MESILEDKLPPLIAAVIDLLKGQPYDESTQPPPQSTLNDLLEEDGCDINAKHPIYWRTALEEAVMAYHQNMPLSDLTDRLLEAITILLEIPATEMNGHNRWSTLHYAVWLPKESGVLKPDLKTRERPRDLLQNLVPKCDVTAQNQFGSTPLHFAAMYGRDIEASMLVQEKAVVTKDMLGWTPLHHAAYHNRGEITELLLNENSQIDFVDAQNDFGQTALHLASAYGHINIAERVLKKGADLNARDQNGKTPVMLAASNGELKVLVMLLKKEADITLTDTNGNCPLMLASDGGRSDVVSLLLERSADTSRKNKDGLTAEQIAKNHNEENGKLDQYKLIMELFTEKKSSLHLSHKDLTDDELADHLKNNLKKGAQYKILHLNHNKLTTLPSLAQYQQFEKLEVLNLSNNSIVTTDRDMLPKNLKKIYLQNNKLNMLTEFSSSTELHEVWLESNNITEIEGIPGSGANIGLAGNPIHVKRDRLQDKEAEVIYWSNLDLTTKTLSHKIESLQNNMKCKVLLLNNNKIERIPDNLKRKFRQLEILNMAHNQLEEGFDESHIPDKLEGLFLNSNLLKEIYPVKCKNIRTIWLHDNEIKIINDIPSSTKEIILINNPVEVFAGECFINMPQELYQALRKGLDFFQRKDLKQPPFEIFEKFTSINGFYREKLSSNTTSRLVLIGETEAGKSSLVRTIMKGKSGLTHIQDRTVVVNVHDWEIDDKYTYQIFDQGGHPIYYITNPFFISNRCTVLIVHDISDKSDNTEKMGNIRLNNKEIEGVNRTLEVFRRTMYQHPYNDIHFVLTKQDGVKGDVNDKMDSFKQKIQKEVIEKEIDTLKRMVKSETDNSDEVANMALIDTYIAKRESCQYFVVSSADYKGIPDLLVFLKNLIVQKSDETPTKWMKFHKNLTSLPGLSCDLKKAEQLYNAPRFRILQNLCCPFISSSSTFNSCLQYLSDSGLLLWYKDNESLENDLFHNIHALIDIMKGVFHHNLEEDIRIVYTEDKEAQAKLTEIEIQAAIKQYEAGLLREEILLLLLSKRSLMQLNKEKIIEVMKHFDICHEIIIENGNEEEITNIGDKSDNKENMKEEIYGQTFYFPWYVKSKAPSYPENFLQIVNLDGETIFFHLEAVFHNKVPYNAPEMFCVRLQRYLYTKKITGKLSAWEKGLCIKVGSTKFFAFQHQHGQRETLNLYIEGKVEHLEELWEHFCELHKSLDSLLKRWYGVLKNYHIICTHCVLRLLPNPKQRRKEEVFPEASTNETYITCNDEKIPAGIIRWLRPDGHTNEQQINDVKKYLEHAYKKRTSAGKVPDSGANNMVNSEVINEQDRNEGASTSASSIKEEGQTSTRQYRSQDIQKIEQITLIQTMNIVVHEGGTFNQGTRSLKPDEIEHQDQKMLRGPAAAVDSSNTAEVAPSEINLVFGQFPNGDDAAKELVYSRNNQENGEGSAGNK